LNNPTLRQLRAEGWGTRKNKNKSKGEIKSNYPTLATAARMGHPNLLSSYFPASFYLRFFLSSR
jgi:hypothetical protein